jgi:hypothetical protein
MAFEELIMKESTKFKRWANRHRPGRGLLCVRSMLNASSEGSIVLTIALGLALTIVQPQSIRRRLNSYNFGAGLDFDYTTVSSIRSRL